MAGKKSKSSKVNKRSTEKMSLKRDQVEKPRNIMSKTAELNKKYDEDVKLVRFLSSFFSQLNCCSLQALIEQGQKMKATGNDVYNQGHYKDALEVYEKSLKFFPEIHIDTAAIHR